MTRPSAVLTRAQFGLATPEVTVECHLPGGLPGFTLVGLPETAVREARDRVKSAISNCGFEFPRGKVVINLAPADLVKEGARFDLPIAVSLLCATGQLPYHATSALEFLGELGLEGDIRAVRGGLCAALALTNGQYNGQRRVVLPAANALDACRAPHGLTLCLSHLRHLADLLKTPEQYLPTPQLSVQTTQIHEPNLDQVRGQQAAKRALLIAAAGGHHLLFVGPPGTGKTLLARCLPSLLPDLTPDQALAVAAIYSAAGLDFPGNTAPFREPHHSASAAAMAGGGAHPRPGEITLAHGGVLFLDELPHFKPSVLDMLREPLVSRRIALARAQYRAEFPAAFQLLAAMNPCPAGRICQRHACRCTPSRVRSYQGRVSGPLLDRIDLQVYVPNLPSEALLSPDPNPGLRYQDAQAAAVSAQSRQRHRQGELNAAHGTQDLIKQLDPPAIALLHRAISKFTLSGRGCHKVLRVARTIADLANEDQIEARHISEALGYRSLDWESGLGCTPY